MKRYRVYPLSNKVLPPCSRTGGNMDSGKEKMNMSFGENLQFYRKSNNITQEQLAEQMNVSRQTISKWESETSYPEMDKLLQLCDLFGCTMDLLLRGDVQENLQEDTAGYDRHMNRFSVKIVTGIGLIFAAEIFRLAGDAFQRQDYLVNSLFLLIIMIGILVLIEGGMQHNRFVKKHPQIKPFYKEEELEIAENRFRVRIITGIGILFAGILFATASDGLPVSTKYGRDIYTSIPMVFFSVGICLIVYAGMQKSKYDVEEDNDAEEDVEEDNKENSPVESRKDHLAAVWRGCIMIVAIILYMIVGLSKVSTPFPFMNVATVLYMIMGFGYDMWDKCWIVYPVGGMLCRIVTLILNGI